MRLAWRDRQGHGAHSIVTHGRQALTFIHSHAPLHGLPGSDNSPIEGILYFVLVLSKNSNGKNLSLPTKSRAFCHSLLFLSFSLHYIHTCNHTTNDHNHAIIKHNVRPHNDHHNTNNLPRLPLPPTGTPRTHLQPRIPPSNQTHHNVHPARESPTQHLPPPDFALHPPGFLQSLRPRHNCLQHLPRSHQG